MQQISNDITNVSTEKRSKEERSELKHKLESMEENDNSREVNISVVPNLHTAAYTLHQRPHEIIPNHLDSGTVQLFIPND